MSIFHHRRSGDNRQTGKTLTHPCSLGSRHPWRLTLSLFLPVNPSCTSTLLKTEKQKTENRKINLLNHPVCGKAAK
ncbi:TPA: hypothetical protein NHT78_001576 [Morganella morganii]|nr:hypothetical protein [Morganella morganii]